MLELVGDLWEAHALGHWVTITTNGVVTRDGRCVMGRGVAKEAATRFPGLPLALGARIREDGHMVHFFPDTRIIAFPVKYHWRDTASLTLIEKSARGMVAKLARLVDPLRKIQAIYMVRPGCGNGGLAWSQVRPVIAPILDNRFIVVNREE